MNKSSGRASDTPGASRRELARERTRAELMAAAGAAFSAKGFHGTSMGQIAAGAGYATGTLYLYFKDKDDLYISLLEDKVRAMLAFCGEAVTSETTVRGQFESLIRGRLAFHEAHRDFFQIYAREGVAPGTRDAPGQWSRVEALCRESVEFTRSVIVRCQRLGLLRKEDPLLLALSLNSILMNISREWMMSGDSKTLRDHAPFVIRLFLEGAQKL